MCGLPDRLTERYAIETLNKDERELINRVKEQDVVTHLKKLVEYQASDPRQQVKAVASRRGMYSQMMHNHFHKTSHNTALTDSF